MTQMMNMLDIGSLQALGCSRKAGELERPDATPALIGGTTRKCKRDACLGVESSDLPPVTILQGNKRTGMSVFSQVFSWEVMCKMADAKQVMVRARELREGGMPNSDALKQAWAEAKAADVKAKAEYGK